ncbi:DUF2190 family protein [Pararhodospirillum photometricum]|uniref:DUF2190 domain-containing protein n=1 Tax=Pararhodospirillum photometricum DSM 122 TaxID=1150469 RepID=H6SSB5_PARPM|nr:DUF2190 family protein [Pararhodospirillum photometricum]CCG07794.1 Putative uncharacterized protein [Pararhodospirillum photometricum DSM 122]
MFVKSYRAKTAIRPYRIVTYPQAGGISEAQGGTASLLGCSIETGADAKGVVDIALSNLAEVRFGGTVAAGEPVTADAEGCAVKAAPASGAQVFVLGFAVEASVSGDIGDVRVSPFILTGV